MSDIDEVLGKLDKKTRERAMRASEIKIGRLKTPSPALNRALKGGFTEGRQHLIYGTKSAGKSSLCLQMIAEAQSKGQSCVWMDVEKTFDPEWAERLGVDTDKLIVEQVSDSMRVTNHIIEYMNAGVDVIVVDSITSITPMSYFEKDSTELKGLEATRQMGTSSKDTSSAVLLWNEQNNGTTLFLISQIRMKITPTYAKGDSTNGNAPRFYSTTILKLVSSESQNQAIKGRVQRGDYIVEEPIGRSVDWLVEANKSGKPWASGKYDFYFDGDEVGVDTLADLVDLATSLGAVQQKGAWYYVGEDKFQGRDNLLQHFREDLDAYDWLVKEVDSRA